MPKVNIYEPHGGDLPPADGVPYDGRRVSVGWAKGTHAQIGIGKVDGNLVVGPQASWSGDFLLEAEKDEHGLPWKTEWVNLDRNTINQLIRELRAARDAAFGRDE